MYSAESLCSHVVPLLGIWAPAVVSIMLGVEEMCVVLGLTFNWCFRRSYRLAIGTEIPEFGDDIVNGRLERVRLVSLS